MRHLASRFWPIFYIFILWFVFSAPYFLKGFVPYPSKYQVTFFAPWSYFQEWWGPVKNNAIPDVITQIYPWKYFTVEWLKHGVIPLWNPNNFAGTPHVGNFQSAVFSPFNLLYFIFPFIDAWSMIVLLQPLLAGVFTYLFLRTVYISRTGSVMGGVAFMFCGFIVVWMAYGTLAMAIAFLPLALYGIEKGYATGRKWYFLLLSFSLASSFFSGHIQTSLYMAMFSGAYLIFAGYTRKDNRGKPLWAFGFYTIGIIISLVQIYPTFQLYQQSPRSTSLHVGGGIPLDHLPTIFAPDFYGNPVTRNDWVGSYAEWASFIGIIPLFFGCIACYFRKNSFVWFFSITGLITLLFSMETPLHGLLVASRVPILATSIPSRMVVLFSFSFAVLAGFGIDAVEDLIQKKHFRKGIPAIAIVGLLVLITWTLTAVFPSFPIDMGQKNIAIKNLILPTILFGTTVLLLLFSVLSRWRKLSTYTFCALVLLASLDSYRFATKWMPFDSRALVFPERRIISAMKKYIGYGRVYGNLGTQVETYYSLPSLEGYDPLYIKRYGEFIRYASNGTFQPAERSVTHLDRNGTYTDRVLDLLGVNLIYHPLADTNQSWAYPVWKDYVKYSVIYQDDKFQLYRNNTALPRVKLFYAFDVISDGGTLLKKFYTNNFDFRNILLLEEKPSIKSGQNEKGKAEITAYTPNSIRVLVTTDSPALLFLSDSYYPNWKARVNGKAAKIYRADYAFRAVVVPQGRSEVEFFYQAY